MIVIRKIYDFSAFLVFYLKNLIIANMHIAYDIITPKYQMRPGILKVPVQNRSDFSILFLNNLITMTPGTLCLNASKDRAYLYVHAMYVKDKNKMIENIKKLEAETNKILCK